ALDAFALPADARYNGDWAFIESTHGLQKIGFGRNVWGLSLDVVADNLLRLNEADTNIQDLIPEEVGELDQGGGELDQGGGELDQGGGDLDQGGGDLDQGGGDLDQGGGELDFSNATNDAPTGLNGTRSAAKQVDLNWQVPLSDGLAPDP